MHQLRTLPVTTEIPSMVPTRQPRSQMAPCLVKMPSNIKHTAGDSCCVYWPARLSAKSTSHTSPHSSACKATAHACPAEEHRSTFAPSLPILNHVKHVTFGKCPFSPQSWLSNWIIKISSTTGDGTEATPSCDQGHSFCIIQSQKLQRACKTHVHSLIHRLLLDLMSKYKLCNDF